MTGVLTRIVVIIAAGLWALAPTLAGGWIMDDVVYYPQNPLLGDPHRLWRIWFEPGSFIEYYPLSATVGYAQWQLWHELTFGYHALDLALHLASALLVWRLLAKLGVRLAWLGGLIFAVHPTGVESVAYAAELKNTLSLPIFLLAMGAWIDFDAHGRPRDYAMALALFTAAMLGKITMALFPVTLLLFAWWRRGRATWRDVRLSAPFFAVTAVLVGMAVLASGRYIAAHDLQQGGVPVGGLLSRVALAGLALAFYYSRCIWPAESLPVYPLWKIDPPTLAQFAPWPLLIALLAWFWFRRTDWGRHALLGVGFFAINLAPFLGFWPISYMRFTWVMDHFLYLPIIGLIGLAVAWLGAFEAKISGATRLATHAVVAVALVAMTLASHAYARQFSDEETLWTYTVAHEPDAWAAWNNLGALSLRAGRVEKAIEQYEMALSLAPDVPDLHCNLGIALMNAHRKAEAASEFREALKLDPQFEIARGYLEKL